MSDRGRISCINISQGSETSVSNLGMGRGRDPGVSPRIPPGTGYYLTTDVSKTHVQQCTISAMLASPFSGLFS